MPKNKKKGLALFIVILLSILCLILGIILYIDSKLEMTNVFIAKYTLTNRTLISEDEIKEISVPKKYLNEEVLLSKEDILGKYVKINTSIPKGSFFYDDALDTYEEIKDKLNTDLLDNEVSFDISANHIKANQAYLNKGMYVDIYLTISKDKVLSDLLINNIKIIGLYDSNKREIKDYDRDSLLSSICFAVPKDALPYLNKAEVLGELSIVVGNNTYSKTKSVLNKNSELFTYLK